MEVLMKNKLFLSLSLLIMAFSQVNAGALINFLPSFEAHSAYKVLRNVRLENARFINSLKVPVVALPAAVVAGGIYALDRLQTQATETPSKFGRVKAALSNAGSYVANTRVANTLVAAGSSVKANVQAHPRIATGAGLVTVAGLSYLAYNKFGKATVKKVETKVVTATPKKAVVSTPVKAKKAKRTLKRRK
jgi:hypothetical protein